jgi:hypothetical protein
MGEVKDLARIDRAIKSAIIMPMCQASIMLVTSSYLQGYLSGHVDILTQVNVAKQLNQPVILMIEKDLTPNELKQVEEIFKHHNVVGKIFFDRDHVKECAEELRKVLERLKEGK